MIGPNRESCKFTRFPASGLYDLEPAGNPVNLHDSLLSCFYGLSLVLTGNPVNLQDFLLLSFTI